MLSQRPIAFLCVGTMLCGMVAKDSEREIEITPEMIEAGADALRDAWGEFWNAENWVMRSLSAAVLCGALQTLDIGGSPRRVSKSRGRRSYSTSALVAEGS